MASTIDDRGQEVGGADCNPLTLWDLHSIKSEIAAMNSLAPRD